MAKVIIDGKEYELRHFISESLAKSDSVNYRDVDSTIDYISNLIDSLSETISLLYEKKLLNVDDVKRIIKLPEINIID